MGAADPIGSEIFSQKAAFSRIKGIWFVVCICDKWRRGWCIVFRPAPFQNFWIRHRVIPLCWGISYSSYLKQILSPNYSIIYANNICIIYAGILLNGQLYWCPQSKFWGTCPLPLPRDLCPCLSQYLQQRKEQKITGLTRDILIHWDHNGSFRETIPAERDA